MKAQQTSAGDVRSAMRVIGWPAFKNRKQNPYNHLLYSSLEAMGVDVLECSTKAILCERYRVFHIHWPEAIWNCKNVLVAAVKASVLLVWFLVAKVNGAKIVWTVHNLQPHEGYHPRLSRLFSRAVTRLVDGFIQLSVVGQQQMQEMFPETRKKLSFIIPHGHYRDIFPAPLSKLDARSRLNLPSSVRVITFCGAIRRYKNIPGLINAFMEMTSGTEGDRLLIAGKAEPIEILDEILRSSADHPSISVSSRLLSEAEMREYVCAADLVVLPYSNILNSGAAILALSYCRPVLVPAMGAMLELQKAVGHDWVNTYEGDLDATKLSLALAAASGRDEMASPNLSDFDWNRIARRTTEAYAELARRCPGPATSGERNGARTSGFSARDGR